MSRTKSSGKYRHIYGDLAKPDGHFLEIKNPLTSGEGSYVAANSTFFAVARSGGGGPVYVRKHDNPGRFAPNAPMVSVSKGKTWDMDFHPFIENMIATATDDTKLYVTQFPMEGLKESVTDPTVTLQGHGKKVTLCTFNPSANSILASGSFDRSVKVWNIENSTCVASYEDFKDNVYSLAWNGDGSMLGASGKDKTIRMFDPRDLEAAQTITGAFDGSKSSKVFWMPEFNWIGATGFSKTAKRQLRLWDCRNLEKPLFSHNIDQASSILMPKYDADTGVLYLSGKGEGSITYFEIVNDDRKLYTLGVYRVPEPQKGGGWVPKKGLDVWKCEVQRFLKLTTKAVKPISFIVPRKAGADVFQEDIFPQCVAGRPALSASEWEQGENKEPVRMSMDPKDRANESNESVGFQKKQSYQELELENQQLRQRVKELEEKLGISHDDEEQKDDDGDNGDGDDGNGDDGDEAPTEE